MHNHFFQHSLDVVSKNYTKLLNNAMAKFNSLQHESGSSFFKAIDIVGNELADAEELSVDETRQLASSLKNDLSSAAEYLKSNKDDLKSWLDLDVTIIEKTLLNAFLDAADKTTVELSQLQTDAIMAEYKSGELIGIAILKCDNCGELLHFHKPSRIPPCPKCQHSHFHRFIPSITE